MPHFTIDSKMEIAEMSRKGDGQSKTHKKKKDTYLLLAKSVNIGYYLITPLLLGVFVGAALDSYFKTEKLTPLFLFLGTIATFYQLKKLVDDH